MDFDEARRAKWAKGRAERGLHHEAPFSGDPAAEAREELLDLANYSEELHRAGRISDEEWWRIYCLAVDLDTCLARA